MRLTLIHPCIGRRPGERYIRSWQMEPLPPATLAGLTPPGVDVRFYDDRMEVVPYDEPTDLVGISVETYTAKRAYEIAGEYRKRRVPVVMGGFHPTLCPDEVSRHADATVVGEAEEIWPRLVDDARHGRLEPMYRAERRPPLAGLRPDRRIFRGKRYLPIGLVEAGRGCHFRCDFCAVQSMFGSTQTRRPLDDVLSEVAALRREKTLFFFVDDNITSNMAQAKAWLRALAPLGIRWVSQASINAAHDEEFLDLLVKSGCQGVLIGFESLDPAALAAMNKQFNTMRGGYEAALANLRRAGLRLYGTFIFGYDTDTPASFAQAVEFAADHRFYIAAFNHLTPFPGTPLYARLAAEGRLRYEAWWLDDRYRYNMVPFEPAGMSAEDLQRQCLEARRRFYSWRSIVRRGVDRVNRGNGFMFRNFFPINAMLRTDTRRRDGWRLGTYPGSSDLAGRGTGLPRPGPRAVIAVEQRYVPLPDAVFPGDIRLALHRAPDPDCAADIDGDQRQLIVARDPDSGRVVGAAARAVRDVYVNGSVARVGYLGQLRIDRSFRRLRTLLEDGFDALRQLHEAGDASLHLTSILADNVAARRLLLHPRWRRAPRFVPLHALRTSAIGLARVPRVSPPAGIRLETGTDAMIDDIAACLQRHGARHQFAPRWTAADLRSDRTRGLAPHDFLVACDGARIVGCLALWDQRAFKQVVVRGYAPRLARWRPVINAAGRLTGGVTLPPVGTPLSIAYLSHAAVDDDRADVYAALAAEQCRQARAAGLDAVVTAFVPGHPFDAAIARAFRRRRYDSVLYGVVWPDGDAQLAALDDRLPQPEVAVL